MTAQQKVEESLAGAMAAAFAEIEAATKSATNPHFKSKYADLGSVIDAIKPALIKHGLFFTQRCHPSEGGVCVETVLHHSAGEELSLGELFVPANKQDAQGFGSALTYARRYGLMTAFGVPAEDDDGNAAARSIPTNEPAAREKLDGPHTSKTALKAAVTKIVRSVQAAGSIEEVDKIKADERVAINQALRDWPELINGDPNVEEDVGLRGVIEKRRSELSPKPEQSLSLQMLLSVLEACETRNDLSALLEEHGAVAEELDGEEARYWEEAYNAREAAIMAASKVSAG